MRKRSIIHNVRHAIPDGAAGLAGRVGESLRHGGDSAGKWLQEIPESAGKWLQAGVAVGAARAGARAVGKVARRHPVAVTAAAVGIGAAIYAVVRHRRKAAERAAIEGRAQRVRSGREVDPHAEDIGDGPSRGED